MNRPVIKYSIYVAGMGFLLFWLWGYFYHPLHYGEHTNQDETILAYALHDLTEIQQCDIINIQKSTYLGGGRALAIEVQRDFKDALSADKMAENGWRDIKTTANSLSAEKKNYCIEIQQKKTRYMLIVTARK